MMRPGGPMQNTGQNPLHTTFKNPNWPPNWINPDNVLEYFCNPANVFYDPSSCNQQIKMQNIARPLEECLVSMNGIQYVLWSAQPPLYVICKHRRNSPQNVTPMAYYYVINGVVYQSPDLHTFVQSRLLGAVDPLKKAFDEIIQYSRYNVAKGYYWEFKDKPAATEEKKDEKPLQARSSNFQQSRTAMLMKNLFDAFPPSDGLEIEPAPSDLKSTAGETEDGQSTQGEMAPPSTSGTTQPPGPGTMDPPTKKVRLPP